jgi:hypothetical protein
MNLNDASTWQATNTEGQIKAKRARGDNFDLLVAGTRSHTHDRAFAESPLDLGHGRIERLIFVHYAYSLIWSVKTLAPGIRR